MDGENLIVKWSSPPAALSRHTTVSYATDFQVDFAQVTDAYSASKGLLKGREDAFASFPQAISREDFNPSILVILTSPSDAALSATRTLHVVTLPQSSSENASRSKHQAVHTLVTMQIPWGHMNSPQSIGDVEYDLQASSGILYELAGGYLTTFNLTGAVAQVNSKLPVKASSFIPLSSTSIVASSDDTMSVYHPGFRSIQASIDIKSALDLDSPSKKRKLGQDSATPKPCRLVGHSTKQSVVLAICGAELLSFQIDARRDDAGRPRSLGLLIDSIGRGLTNSATDKPDELEPLELNSLGDYVPGSTHDHKTQAVKEKLDILVESQDVATFEARMVKLVGLWGDHQLLENGSVVTKEGKGDQHPLADANFGPWMWPKQKSDYPLYDPAWAQYAISRIFSWSNDRPTEEMRESATSGEDRLHIVFFPPNVLYWLIQTGNLNKNSITSALQSELRASSAKEIPAGQIVKSLLEVDPEMELLLSLISKTYLEAPELLHAIRHIMDSLELFGENGENQLALTSGEQSAATNGDLDAEIAFEEDQADLDLQLAEYRLGDGSSVRHQALSMALAKLYTCPSKAVVQALQSTLTLNEIVSLIYLLRFELAGGSWTSRYLDFYVMGDDSGPPDSAIMLISTLLSRCIDAVGAGGWLSGDAMLVNGDHFESEELITSLKLEVSAALEGVEEASYLRGLTAEMVRFAESSQKATASSGKRTKHGDVKPVVLAAAAASEQDVPMLPFGLKVEQQISLQKVGAGGELYNRSLRDIGRLKSRKVGKYTRERIVL